MIKFFKSRSTKTHGAGWPAGSKILNAKADAFQAGPENAFISPDAVVNYRMSFLHCRQGRPAFATGNRYFTRNDRMNLILFFGLGGFH